MRLFDILTEGKRCSRSWLIIIQAFPLFLVVFLFQSCRLPAVAREVKQLPCSPHSLSKTVELDSTCSMQKEAFSGSLKKVNRLSPSLRLVSDSRDRLLFPTISGRRFEPPLLQADSLIFLGFVAAIGLPFCLLASKMVSQPDQFDTGKNPSQGSSQPSTSSKEAAATSMAPDDTLSLRIGTETSGSDAVERGKHPIWIRYEPRFGPWVTIAVGAQLAATHKFRRFGITEWQIGEITEIAESGRLVIVGFHPDAPSYYPNEPELYTGIRDNKVEPFWSSPFVLLERSLKRQLPSLPRRDEEDTHYLVRAGKHIFDLLPEKEEASFEQAR